MRILGECKKCHLQYDVSGLAAGAAATCRCGAQFLVPEPRVELARMVRCAGCGASRNSGGDNCEFCGARFSFADKGWGSMCPACFCRLPCDAAFCVECGTAINPQSLNPAASDLNCPRCACALRPRTFETVSLQECPSCAGLWLGSQTFEAICNQRETQAIATQGLDAHHGRKRFELSESQKVKYVPCPVCRELMNRRNFAQISGVVIDTCKMHGIWLDNQELGQIVKFIQGGGLDKARQKEIDDAAHSVKLNQMRGRSLAASLPLDFGNMDAVQSRPADTKRLLNNVGTAFDVAGVMLDIAAVFFRH
jgi:Zn-finger nucleic acid-binding protein